jgi:hypothetical protein
MTTIALNTPIDFMVVIPVLVVVGAIAAVWLVNALFE